MDYPIPYHAGTKGTSSNYDDEADLAIEKEFVARAPDKLKSPNTRKAFIEPFETYLGQLLGFGIPPLKYIIRV
jgi:hypothetical protein